MKKWQEKGLTPKMRAAAIGLSALIRGTMSTALANRRVVEAIEAAVRDERARITETHNRSPS